LKLILHPLDFPSYSSSNSLIFERRGQAKKSAGTDLIPFDEDLPQPSTPVAESRAESRTENFKKEDSADRKPIEKSGDWTDFSP
jgi:hypothetical protein